MELIEGTREQERAGKLTRQLARLLARRARLEAERDGSLAVQEPAQLVALVGKEAADAMVSAEETLLRLEQSRRETQQAEATAAAAAARKEIDALNAKLLQLDELTRVHGEHLNAMRKLEDLATRASVIKVRSDLAEAEVRRQDSHAALAAAEARLVQAEGAAAKLSSDRDTELAKAVAATEAEIGDVRLSLQSAGRIAAALGQGRSLHAQDARPVYEIVRRGRDGAVVLPALEETPLLPDDVLHVKLEAAPQPAGALRLSQDVGREVDNTAR